MKSFMSDLFFVVALILFCTLCALAAFGCQPRPQITAIQQQSQVDVAAQKAKDALAAQKAKDNPIAHPILAAAQATAAAQKPLGLIATIASLICALGVGLYFTPLSAISKFLVPVAGGVAAFSFFGVIALPFFPYVILGAVALVLGLFIYEIARYRSLPKAITAIESDLGIGSSTAAVTLTQLIHQ